MRSLRIVLASCSALALAGCQYLQFLPFLKRSVDTRARGERHTWRGTAFGDGAASRFVPNAESDWLAYNRDPNTGMRFSPLDRITTSNVSALLLACSAPLGETAAMESGPIVVDGVLYVTSALDTWAIDAATCRTRWKHRYAYEPKPDWDLKVNRGVAFIDTPDGPRVVRGANDGRVYALDARTGDEVWNVRAGDPGRGETFPASPVAWNGMIYIGNAGGDNFGVTGRMLALDARTGAQRWRAELVPRSGPAASTWPAETEGIPHGGATTWTSYTLDSAHALLYVPTGNAAPDFQQSVRPGANDYTYSIVVLDARTGELRRAYKLLPFDVHDWDVAAAPLLLTTSAGTPLVVAAAKDGYLYAAERENGRLRYKTPVTTIANVDAPLTRAGTRFCPGVQGGVEWNGPAYSPRTNLLYVGAVDWCTTVRLGAPSELRGKRGIPWTGSARLTEPFGKMDPKSGARGWITAIDADAGTVRWRLPQPTPIVAGITATAGGLVFAANLRGTIMALDARDGATRWRYDAGDPIGGGIVTYAVRGAQYVAVAVGLDAPITWQTKSRPARVLVFALP